jgi:hypothetical protein
MCCKCTSSKFSNDKVLFIIRNMSEVHAPIRNVSSDVRRVPAITSSTRAITNP